LNLESLNLEKKTMLNNYLKVALRNIFRNKLTASINMAGLALSMTCALMISLYISDEVSFDRYHKNADRTYRITRDFLSPDGTTNLRLANVAPPIGPFIFDIDFLSGNPASSLENPFTVMFSEKTAKRYFNDTNVMGKRLRAGNQYDLEVTGVYKDFPKQSH
jgi:putative ABC transport system permease protein